MDLTAVCGQSIWVLRLHRTQICSTCPIGRLNAKIKRRTHVVSIFPNVPSIKRLVGEMMLELNGEPRLNRRYMQVEALQSLCDTVPTWPAAVPRYVPCASACPGC